ncbi:MAG: gliding motility protein GldM [Bacteroidales bacterium]|nr:gliding motility protein GldM [Bacteroidales bacterium]
MATKNCPEAPRQKMIGMMYLFYTALLALNVSNEVITAFVAVNDSMETTTKNFAEKSAGQYNNLRLAYEGQPEKYQATWEDALEIQKQSDELFNYVADLKTDILRASEGSKKDISKVTTNMKLDNLEAAPQIMVSDGGPKKGVELRRLVEKHREFLLNFIEDPEASHVIYASIADALDTPDVESTEASERRTWERSLCEGMPMVGTIALLTKLQADIRNSEADIIAYLNAKVSALDIRISKLSALVNANSGYVISGGTYSAKIFIGAQDTSMRPTVWITTHAPYYDSIEENGVWKYKKLSGVTYDTLPLDDFGAGLYEKQSGVGDYSYGGLIEYQSNIDVLWMPFKSNYKVGATSATVSPTELLVLYLGIDNPIKVSAAGYSLESLTVSANGAQIKRGGKAGEYMVYGITPGVTEVKINVNADGKTIGSETYRVKRVPAPQLVLGTVPSGGSVSINDLINTPIRAYSAPGFIYENAKYSVASFTITIPVPGGLPQTMSINGSKIADNPSAAAAVRNGVRRGTVVMLSKFVVNSPSGRMEAPGISFTII